MRSQFQQHPKVIWGTLGIIIVMITLICFTENTERNDHGKVYLTNSSHMHLTRIKRRDSMIKRHNANLNRCAGNWGCALSLDIADNITDIHNGSCWICHAMSSNWVALPLNNVTAAEANADNTSCIISITTMAVLQILAYYKQTGRPNSAVPGCNYPNNLCFDAPGSYCSPLPVKKYEDNSTYMVPWQKGDTCVVQDQKENGEIDLGWSECTTYVRITNRSKGRSPKCSIDGNYFPNDGSCPFIELSSTNTVMWVCGSIAYVTLPRYFNWTGSCYPAYVTPSVSVHTENPWGPRMSENRRKRDVPIKFHGYTLGNPWTSPGANVGWSLFLGGGTAVALNKVNGLAYMLLILKNDTVNALQLVNDELKQVREITIQNRMALDILLAERGGVCKVLNTSCCFYIPDNHQNISNIINHMKKALQPPPQVESWISWFTQLWGGWGYWLVYSVLPIGIMILLGLCITPCICRCIQELVLNTVKYQMLRQTDNTKQKTDWDDPTSDRVQNSGDYHFEFLDHDMEEDIM